jgi:hypothetical protein
MGGVSLLLPLMGWQVIQLYQKQVIVSRYLRMFDARKERDEAKPTPSSRLLVHQCIIVPPMGKYKQYFL